MILDESTIARWLKALELDESQVPTEELGKISLEYRIATDAEVEALETEVLGFIENDSIVQAGPKRRDAWLKGWQENLDALTGGEGISESVKPRYFRENHWYRVDGKLAWFENPFSEYEILAAARKPMFSKFFAECEEVVEVGCGSGQNIYDLANLFPEKRLRGFDWVESSARLIDEMGKSLERPISGSVFDMEHPDYGVSLGSKTGVLTYHAFEQLGDRFGAMLDFLLEKAPSIVVQVEPIEENYDLDNPVDRLAKDYHRHRGYLSGYLSALKELEREGQIEIISAFRIPFGSRFHEANGVVAWRKI